MNEAKLVVRPAELRPMAKQVVDGTIDKSSPLKIFKILRAAGKKVKVEKGGDTSRTGRKIVIEKSVSKQQQKFMGMVRAVQKGEMDAPSPEVAKAAKTMKKKDVKDFAKTKHKGLPDKKDEACWDGYKQVGMKKKGNKMVPDCVPEGKSFFAFRAELEESVDEKIGSPMNIKRDGKKIHLVKKGNKWHLTVDGKKTVHDSEKSAMQHTARLRYAKEEVELDETTIKDIKDILTTIGSSKNMDQAVQMVMKKYKVPQGQAKAMVKKAIDSGVTYDKIKKKYAKESVELDEAVTVSRKDFDSLKKGDKVTITFDSSVRKGNTATYVIKGKSRSAKYNVDKISMQPEGKPGVQKSFLYSRDGKDATMAQGDMGVTMTKFVKESIEEKRDAGKNAIDLARDVVKNKGAKKGLDMQTANAILTVYNKVNDANKKKMETMPVAKLASAVWKILGKAK